MCVKRNIEALSCNNWCSEKAINITNSQCVFVPLGIQHAMCMCHIILSAAPCLVLQNFIALSHERHDFREKKGNEYEISVLIFSTNFV